ncbi:unnamed protein product [Sphagnum troendelagicum]
MILLDVYCISINWLVKKIITVLENSSWGPKTEEALMELNIMLSPHLVDEVLRRQKDGKSAFSFFKWVLKQPSYTHSASTCNLMIHQLSGAREFELLPYVLDELKRKGGSVNSASLRIALLSYAFRIYQQMRRNNCSPSAYTFSLLIHGFRHARRGGMAAMLMQEMMHAGFTPNVVTYNAVIDCLGKAGKLDLARKLFEDMKQTAFPPNQGCAPDVITYNSLINGFGKAGHVDDAFRLFEKMKVKGCSPDVVTYNCLINGLGRMAKLEDVSKLFKEMKAEGCPPDTITYSSIIYILGKGGQPNEACQLFAEMRDKGCTPDVQTYNSVKKKKKNSVSVELLVDTIKRKHILYRRISIVIK